MTAPRIATYHRVSTLDQNPELARDELRAAAERMGGGALALVVEETGSGAKADRPGLARIMAAARAGAVDTVLVWKLDRFGRSALDLLQNIRELEARGVRFMATSQGIDIGPATGAVGRLLLTVLAAVAEFERELTRERTHLGIAKARKAGKHLGRPPALLTPALVARAAEIRSGFDSPIGPASWREVRARLAAEGWQTLPSHATIARACTKPPHALPAAAPRRSGG